MGVVRLHSSGKMEPSDPMDLSTFTSDDQTELFHQFFATENESITAGIWECAPCFEEIKNYPSYKMIGLNMGSGMTSWDMPDPQRTFVSCATNLLPFAFPIPDGEMI